MSGRKVPEEMKAEMKRLYVEEGKSLTEIAWLLGVDSNTVSRHLKLMGVKLRSTIAREERARRDEQERQEIERLNAAPREEWTELDHYRAIDLGLYGPMDAFQKFTLRMKIAFAQAEREGVNIGEAFSAFASPGR